MKAGSADNAQLQRPDEHLSGYQRRDYEVVDYQMYKLDGTELFFRGPQASSLETGEYFTCIGAAQTFGCFCEEPFPALLGRELNLPALNLGYGGAGAEFFTRHKSLDRYINGGRFVVLQVMSGRSQSNSLFDCRGLEYTIRRADRLPMSADDAYRDLLFGIPPLPPSEFTPAVRRVLRAVFRRFPVPKLFMGSKVRRLVRETRLAWIESYRSLLERIHVPVVLLWFSKRTPAYEESLTDVYSLFGEFPQLVNSEMVGRIRQGCDAYVECTTRRGSPQALMSRYTGLPVTVNPGLDRADFRDAPKWTHNTYYPSPEMHEDAAKALLPVCNRLRLSQESPR